STCAGVDEVVAEGAAVPPHDYQAPLMSLPGLLGTTPENTPAEVPYLRAEPERVERWRARLEGLGEVKVGVCLQGQPRFDWDRWRSAALAEFAPLAAVPGVRLVSLQRGQGCEQVRALRGRFEVADLGEDLDAEGAFLDSAALVECLDLVVSVDSAVGHLA